jgi:hypothetical protein
LTIPVSKLYIRNKQQGTNKITAAAILKLAEYKPLKDLPLQFNKEFSQD